MSHQKFSLLAILSLLCLLTACRQDISLPTPTLEKLFGTWEWVQSSGGFGGWTHTPSAAGYTQTIEFNPKGIYKMYQNGQEKDKLKFTLREGESISNRGVSYLIQYKGKGLFPKQRDERIQSVNFGGQDTLFLNDECYDCYGHIYVRKK